MMAGFAYIFDARAGKSVIGRKNCNIIGASTIKAHDGRIWVESMPNKSSTFIITLSSRQKEE